MLKLKNNVTFFASSILSEGSCLCDTNFLPSGYAIDVYLPF